MRPVALLSLGLILAFFGCDREKTLTRPLSLDPGTRAQFEDFVSQKCAQSQGGTLLIQPENSPDLQAFFTAAGGKDWVAMDADYGTLLRDSAHAYLRGIAWEAAKEIEGTYTAFTEGDPKYSTLYANEIINSIPRGSIYFGGTDPGRFLITGMEKSQIHGDPFFLITQNALVDNSYLDYVHSMYDNQLYIPTAKDSERCFRDYTADAQQRLQNHQLKAGENVSVDPESGRVTVSGQAAVMRINALIAKIVFDQNSNHNFYIEQSFPLDWMYPYLEPHGMILKLDHDPLSNLSDTVIRQDHDYWSNLIQPIIGDWLRDDTSVQDVANFAQNVFLHHDFTGFTGDQRFVMNKNARQMFSKERANIAGLYLWRAEHATDAAEKQRMNAAADYACRQAWTLCPYFPEATIRYVNLLMDETRMSDALIVAETAAEFRSNAGIDRSQYSQMDDLVSQVKKYQAK